MFETLTFWHWAIIAVGLLLAELMIGAEFMLWLAAAAGASSLVSLAAPQLDWKIQLVLYAAFSLAALLGWAKYSRNAKVAPTDQPNLNQRYYKYVGRTFPLLNALENAEGKIMADDAQWQVRANDGTVTAKKGAMVKVVGVDGMVLLIELA